MAASTPDSVSGLLDAAPSRRGAPVVVAAPKVAVPAADFRFAKRQPTTMLCLSERVADECKNACNPLTSHGNA